MLRKAKARSAPDLLTDPGRRRKFRTDLTRWFEKCGRDLPWRRTLDPYAVLVSEFMLQQTQVSTVIPYFERWLARFPNFGVLAGASESEVLQTWQGLGYYARARNLHRAAGCVMEKHGGELPDDPAAIAALPGVGRYTAGAVANFAFDRTAPAVDANIGRVLARLTDFREPIDAPAGVAGIWRIAEALLPEAGGRIYTSALMELGALICTPQRPRCPECPVRGVCAVREPESLPAKKPRRKTALLTEDCGWMVKEGRVLLELQTGARWRGLWKLPRLESIPEAEPIFETAYPFTHHRVAFRVFRTSAPTPIGDHWAWFSLGDLEAVAMAAAHRRAARTLGQTKPDGVKSARCESKTVQ